MTFLGWLSDPFKWLSDLQLGDEKVTLNHLDCGFPKHEILQVPKWLPPLLQCLTSVPPRCVLSHQKRTFSFTDEFFLGGRGKTVTVAGCKAGGHMGKPREKFRIFVDVIHR